TSRSCGPGASGGLPRWRAIRARRSRRSGRSARARSCRPRRRRRRRRSRGTAGTGAPRRSGERPSRGGGRGGRGRVVRFGAAVNGSTNDQYGSTSDQYRSTNNQYKNTNIPTNIVRLRALERVNAHQNQQNDLLKKKNMPYGRGDSADNEAQHTQEHKTNVQ